MCYVLHFFHVAHSTSPAGGGQLEDQPRPLHPAFQYDNLFEFKLDKSAAEALQQIKDHDCAREYRFAGKPLTLIGANFDTAKRKVSEWKQERDAV